MAQTRLEFVLDLDGVLVAQTVKYSPDAFIDPKNKDLPQFWQDYHANNTVAIEVDGQTLYYLLLPHAIETLGYLFIDLAEIANTTVFSGGPEKRNIELLRILKEKVAKNRGVSPDTIQYRVFSSQHCRALSCLDPLQPSCENTPHIPLDCNFWNYAVTAKKKVLTSIFGQDISKVIIIDNCYGVMIANETDHHFKVPTFDSFSGSDFFDYRDDNYSQHQKHVSNMLFFQNHQQFYRVNSACLIVGTIDAIVRSFQTTNTPPVTTLKKIQLCPKTNKYRAALTDYPQYKKYRLDLIYAGFLRLRKINPSIELFAPYHSIVLEDLQAHCQKQYGTDFKSKQLHGTNEFKRSSISSHSFEQDNSSFQMLPLQTQLIPSHLPAADNSILNQLQINQSRRHSVLSWEATMSPLAAHGTFSQTEQKKKTENVKPLLTPDNPTKKQNEPSRCCVLL